MESRGKLWFTDTHTVTLDEKNRTIVPAAIRDTLNAKEIPLEFYLSPGVASPCLFLFDRGSFDRIWESMTKLAPFQKNSLEFKRAYFSRSSPVACDSLGRILIPEKLKNTAKISREVTFVGAGEWVEIWNAETWSQISEKMNERFEEIAKALFDGEQGLKLGPN